MNISKERARLNLTQEQLAKILKISNRQLQRWEAGEKVRYLVEKGIESCLKGL